MQVGADPALGNGLRLFGLGYLAAGENLDLIFKLGLHNIEVESTTALIKYYMYAVVCELELLLLAGLNCTYALAKETRNLQSYLRLLVRTSSR